MKVLVLISETLLFVTGALLLAYAVRHYVLALWRLLFAARNDTMDLVGYVLPRLTVLVPMHDEERVARDLLEALVECDYDWDRLQVLAINDRSSDQTPEII